MLITAKPRGFDAPHFVEGIEEGANLQQIVDYVRARAGIPKAWHSYSQVQMNGQIIPSDQWSDYYPSGQDNVVVTTSLHGGGEGKNPIATILTIATVAYAPTIAAGALGGFGRALFTVGAQMLINAAFPVRQPNLANQQGQDSPTYSISGSRNSARPFSTVPVVLGAHRHTPPLGSKSFTEILGYDEYLRMLVVWGYGPLKIENIRIGETLLSDYTDVETQTFEGRDSDGDITLFPSSVSQEQIGAELTNAGGYVSRTTGLNAEEISVDIGFLRGLVEFTDSGSRKSRTVLISAQYKEVSSGTWIDLWDEQDILAQSYTFGGVYDEDDEVDTTLFKSLYINYVTGEITASVGESLFGTTIGTPVQDYDKIADVEIDFTDIDSSYTITNITTYTTSRFTGLVVSDAGAADGRTVNITSGTIKKQPIIVTAKTASSVRKGFRWSVANGQYDVRLRRETADTTDTAITDDSTWTALRTITNDSPINFCHPLAVTALRIKASEQLSGVVDNLNADVTSYCSTWNGSDWTTEAATNNPAALYRHVLTSNANSRARTASQLDDAALGDWYDFCETNGYKFNMVRDAQKSVWDTLADIAAAGRAAPTLTDGKWSVIKDEASKPVRQHFTPRNSWGFQASKTLPDSPHAWRVRFVNENENYAQDEVIVYDDGYSASNATKFEGIEFPGVTDSDLVWKFGRYHIAQMRLRPEEYTFSADFEHLACERGDVILVSHDVPLWGLGWGRVKSSASSGGLIETITVDEAFVMEAGKTYNIRLRLEDGTSKLVDIDTVVGSNTTLTLTTPEAINVLKGDLCIFGETGTETQRLIVKSIDRGRDFTAKITCVDESPAIYDADTGIIPAFDSNITEAINVLDVAPPVPVITNIESGTAALIAIGDGFLARILVNMEKTASNTRVRDFRIRWRTEIDDPWTFVTIDAQEGTAIISPAFEGVNYTIQAQAISEYGVASEWTDAIVHTVVGQDELPADVEGFVADIVGTEAHLSWEPIVAIDLAYYRIRWTPDTTGVTWNSSVDIVRRATGSSASAPAQVGTYLIKAVDHQGNESENPAIYTSTLAKLTGLNIVESVLDENPTWDGTNDSTYYSPSIGGLILDADGDLYDSPDLYAEGDLYIYGALAEEGYYYPTETVDLGAKYTSRISGELGVSGTNLASNLYSIPDLYGADNLYGVSDGQFSVNVELRTTDDDPTGSPTWSSWSKLVVGDYSARAYQFRVKLIGDGNYVTPIVTRAYIEVDMPDRILRFSATIPIGGDRVDFSPAFYDFPGDRGLGISVFDGAEGDKYTITNLDKTGFDIAFTNSGSGVERQISGIAQSYGELI